MIDWLDHPALEAKLKELAAKPPDVRRLLEAVQAISAATERTVRTEIWVNGAQNHIFTASPRGGPKIVKLRDSGVCFDPSCRDEKRVDIYNCEVVDGRYVAHVQSGADRREEGALGFEQLAWRCCGYLFTPGEVRAAQARAKNAGFTGPIPLRYFSEKSA